MVNVLIVPTTPNFFKNYIPSVVTTFYGEHAEKNLKEINVTTVKRNVLYTLAPQILE